MPISVDAARERSDAGERNDQKRDEGNLLASRCHQSTIQTDHHRTHSPTSVQSLTAVVVPTFSVLMARGNVNDEEGAIPLLPTPTSLSYDPAELVSKPDAIPWKSLCPILALRLSDGMAYGVIFPFITAYLVSIHAPVDKIGLYAGMAEGTLMLVEAALATTWARLADKYGRRPCMIWGFAATTVACGSMGLCTQAWQIILLASSL